MQGNYKGLKVYQKSLEIFEKITQLENRLPRMEYHSHTEPLKVVGANISAYIAAADQLDEAVKKRKYNCALGATKEVECRIEQLKRRNFISEEESKTIEELILEVIKMLVTLIKKN